MKEKAFTIEQIAKALEESTQDMKETVFNMSEEERHDVRKAIIFIVIASGSVLYNISQFILWIFS